MDKNIYSLYKPLRNYSRSLKFNESLLAIHAHLQFQQFHKQLPSYITGEPYGYRNIHSFSDLLQFHLFPWELVILCKEILINSENYGVQHSLLEWKYLSELVNKLKNFENELAKIYTSKDNVLMEFFRMSHRQFRWQRALTLEIPARYWKIFSKPDLDKIIQQGVGLNYKDILKIGLGLLGFFEDKIALYYPPRINIPGISREKLDIFLDHFCEDFISLKQQLKNEQQFNENYNYSYCSLVRYPLVRMPWEGRESIVCPIPRYLYERITEGIYYEIFKVKGFDNIFGQSYQNYIGEVANLLFKKGIVYPEKKYNGKLTVDWIIKDKSALLFIECKTKRLTIGAKTSLFNLDELDKQLEILASAIIQVYKTLEDYKKGFYPGLKYDKSRPFYPLIVTLEEWFIFGDKIQDMLQKKVIKLLNLASIPVSVISQNPYLIVSTETFESLVEIINNHQILDVLAKPLFDSDKRLWQLDNYLRTKYKEMNKAGCPFTEEFSNYINLAAVAE